MSTALILRYSAYGLYLISFIYSLVLSSLFVINRFSKSPKLGEVAEGSLSEQISVLNQWAEEADSYEESDGHSRRIADLARQLGENYSLSDEDLDGLECAALLHDIGQINNFDFIKENRDLTLEEKIYLEEHPVIGEETALQITNIENAPLWVRWHHERWDGCGYPDGLAGELIPLPVRILSVVDAYDALTNDRPHRQAMSTDEALNELQKMSGIMFDPNVIQMFSSIISEPERGSSLEL